MGTRSPSRKAERTPSPQIFGPCLLWQTAGWMKLVLGMVIRLSPGDCVIWGPSPLSQKGAEPLLQFSIHFYCGQTAACIKIPLGMDVGLSPKDFLLDGDPVPNPQKGADPPPPKKKKSAHVYCGQTAGWIKMPLGTNYEGRPQPGGLCLYFKKGGLYKRKPHVFRGT